MGYSSALNSLLNNHVPLTDLFPEIKLMILPKEEDGNYISFRKTASNGISTLDNYFRDEADYEIRAYAKSFQDLEDAETILVPLLNGVRCGGGTISLVGIDEAENSDIKKYYKTFRIQIR